MRSSRGEIKIAEVLQAAGLNFQEEYIFPDLIAESGRPLRFDFCVFDDEGEIDFLIEYQGLQHFEPVDFGGNGKQIANRLFLDNVKRDKQKKEK